MSNQILRNYDGTDTFMLESAEVMLAAFLPDLPDFTAFDTTLDATFATNWQTAITTARSTATDNTVVGEQKDRTQQVQQAMAQARNAYMDVIYFAEKAFKNQPGILQKFGKGDSYRKAHKTQPRMLEFFEELVATVTQYTTQLTAAGAPAATLSAPAAALTALTNLNVSQNLQIKQRPVFTRERIESYNTVYSFMEQVSEAAQRIYRNNPEKLGQYMYNPPRINYTTINQNIAGGGTQLVLANIPYQPARNIRLQTNQPIDIALSTDGNTPGVNGWIPVTANTNHSGEIQDLGPEGDYVLIRNNGPAAADVVFKYEE